MRERKPDLAFSSEDVLFHDGRGVKSAKKRFKSCENLD